MEISEALQYYIEEKGIENLPNSQFYSFLSDLCKDEVSPFRFILKFPDFSKMYADLLRTPGSYLDIKQISYKWSQITGFKEDLITDLLRNLSKGIRKTISNPHPEEKKLPLLILFNKYHHPDTKYLDFLKKGEAIRDIIIALQLNAEKRAYENKIRKSKYLLRYYLEEKEKQDKEKTRIASEEARVAAKQEREKEERKQKRLEAKAKKEKEEAIKEASDIKNKIERDYSGWIIFFGTIFSISLVIYILGYSNIVYVKRGNAYISNLVSNPNYQVIIYIIIFMVLVFGLFFIIFQFTHFYTKISNYRRLKKWKKRNPNHRATPYL